MRIPARWWLIIFAVAVAVNVAALIRDEVARGAQAKPAHSASYYRAGWRGEIREHARTLRANRVLRSRLDKVTGQLWRAQRARRASSTLTYSSRYAIHLAAITWRQSESDLLRVAECESPGLDPGLVNREPIYNGEHATGLFQFLPSTWHSTPYASESIFDPVANSLAAGWMWTNGRRGEWACK